MGDHTWSTSFWLALPGGRGPTLVREVLNPAGVYRCRATLNGAGVLDVSLEVAAGELKAEVQLAAHMEAARWAAQIIEPVGGEQPLYPPPDCVVTVIVHPYREEKPPEAP